TVKEVAALFHVSTETVLTWVRTGKIPTVRTPGGHPRFHPERIRALLHAEEGQE
ncbi:helix-turn-helix domain-containing protein, partial [Halostreptopolyspora alba]